MILKREKKYAASADGGPRSRVRARGTLRSAPHRHQRNFSGACFCRITFRHLPQPLQSHIQDPSQKSGPLFWGGKGAPKNLIFIVILLFLLLRSPCQNLKSYDSPFWGKSRGSNKKRKNYQKQWPPSFVTAATGSARTPVGPKELQRNRGLSQLL